MEPSPRPQFRDGVDSLMFSVLLATIEDYLRCSALAIDDVKDCSGVWVFSFQCICEYLGIDVCRLRKALPTLTLRQWKRIRREYDLMFRSPTKLHTPPPQMEPRTCPTCGTVFYKETRFCCRRCVRFTKKKNYNLDPSSHIITVGGSNEQTEVRG